MMKKVTLFSFVIAITMVSCKKTETTQTNPDEVVITESVIDTITPIVDASSAQNSIDWAGTYTAQLPCANCPGILTEVTLNADNTFTVVNDYIDNPTNRLSDQGTIVWYDNGNSIELKGDDSTEKYKVIENGLIQLDTEGNEINTNLKEFYVFKKKTE